MILEDVYMDMKIENLTGEELLGSRSKKRKWDGGCPSPRCTRPGGAAPPPAGSRRTWGHGWHADHRARVGRRAADSGAASPRRPPRPPEPSRRGEHRAGVAHRDPVAQEGADTGHGGRVVDRPEDQHARRRCEGVQEDGDGVLAPLAVRPVVPLPRGALGQLAARVGGDGDVQAGRAERTGHPAGWPCRRPARPGRSSRGNGTLRRVALLLGSSGSVEPRGTGHSVGWPRPVVRLVPAGRAGERDIARSGPRSSSGHTASVAPRGAGPSDTVATVTGLARGHRLGHCAEGRIGLAGHTRRTSSVISPPQVRPTAKASSSLYPKRSRSASPEAITSGPARTSPPPRSRRRRCRRPRRPDPPPGRRPGRGVRCARHATTVASPKGVPLADHAYSAGRMSRIVRSSRRRPAPLQGSGPLDDQVPVTFKDPPRDTISLSVEMRTPFMSTQEGT